MKLAEAFQKDRRKALVTGIVAISALSILKSAPAQAQPPPWLETRDTSAPLFAEATCPATVRASLDAFALSNVSCGFVEVPESYEPSCAEPKTLRLFMVIAKTAATHPLAPVLFVAGGPGQSLSSIAGQVFATGAMGRVRAQRDIVLIDPRGSGYSEPRLRCSPAALAPSSRRDTRTRTLTPLQIDSLRCAQALREQGVDLAAYNTSNLARDLKRVRRALNAPKVALYGVSYGALLALQALRGANDWVESAVLVSIPRTQGGTVVRAGASAQEALDTLADACASQPSCAAHGELGANVDALLTQLTARPLDLGVSSTGVPVQLTADLLAIFVQRSLGEVPIASLLPKAVAEALRGHGELWLPLVEAFTSQPPPPVDFDLLSSEPLHNSVWCSEELVIGSSAEMYRRAARSDAIVRRYFVPPLESAYETCAVWPVPEADRKFYAPVVSEVPTYLIAGALDPITRPSFAEYALRYLPNGQLTTFVDAGHLAAEFAACGPELVERFFNAPNAVVEDSCAGIPFQFAP